MLTGDRAYSRHNSILTSLNETQTIPTIVRDVANSTFKNYDTYIKNLQLENGNISKNLKEIDTKIEKIRNKQEIGEMLQKKQNMMITSLELETKIEFNNMNKKLSLLQEKFEIIIEKINKIYEKVEQITSVDDYDEKLNANEENNTINEYLVNNTHRLGENELESTAERKQEYANESTAEIDNHDEPDVEINENNLDQFLSGGDVLEIKSNSSISNQSTSILDFKPESDSETTPMSFIDDSANSATPSIASVTPSDDTHSEDTTTNVDHSEDIVPNFNDYLPQLINMLNMNRQEPVEKDESDLNDVINDVMKEFTKNNVAEDKVEEVDKVVEKTINEVVNADNVEVMEVTQNIVEPNIIENAEDSEADKKLDEEVSKNEADKDKKLDEEVSKSESDKDKKLDEVSKNEADKDKKLDEEVEVKKETPKARKPVNRKKNKEVVNPVDMSSIIGKAKRGRPKKTK